MDKPQVDRIEGIPPAIAIDQTNPVRTSRSTVGTMTELNDHLKLLFARAAHCTAAAAAAGAARRRRRDRRRLLAERARRRSAPGRDLPGAGAGQLQRAEISAARTAGLHAHPPRAGKRRSGVVQDRFRGNAPSARASSRRWRRRCAWARAGRVCGRRRRPGTGVALSPTCTAPDCDIHYSDPTPACSRSTRRSAPARPAAASAA
jgi:excinuclease ABC subunit A